MTRSQSINRALELKSDEDVVASLRERMPEALEQLAEIACGNVPRNAASILKGIELQLRFSQPLPKQTIEHQGAVGIAVIDPYATPAETTAEVPLAQQGEAPCTPSAVPPVVRRKAPGSGG